MCVAACSCLARTCLIRSEYLGITSYTLSTYPPGSPNTTSTPSCIRVSKNISAPIILAISKLPPYFMRSAYCHGAARSFLFMLPFGNSRFHSVFERKLYLFQFPDFHLVIERECVFTLEAPDDIVEFPVLEV